MNQPIFETPRLAIRPRTLADTAACVAMDRDESRGDPAAHRAFVEERTCGPYPPGLGYWTILQRGAEPGFVGWLLMIPLAIEGPELEIGWRIRQNAWGQGYATEAAACLLGHGLSALAHPEIVADIDHANLGSRRVAEKIGLRLRGERRFRGRAALRYALARDEWTAGEGRRAVRPISSR